MDAIMWLLTGIFIYLAIGYIFVLWTEAYEDGFWVEFKMMFFWPIFVITFCISCIYFGWKEMYKKTKKYEQRKL